MLSSDSRSATTLIRRFLSSYRSFRTVSSRWEVPRLKASFVYPVTETSFPS